MITIFNKFIPFKDYTAMTVWPFVFIRNDVRYTRRMSNHENIHGEQQKEVLAVAIILFILLWLLGCGIWSLLILPLYFYSYVIGWLYRLIFWYRDRDKAYYTSLFEKEAYEFQDDFNYLSRRKHFAWLKYM